MVWTDKQGIEDALEVIEEGLYYLPRARTEYQSYYPSPQVFDVMTKWIGILEYIKAGLSGTAKLRIEDNKVKKVELSSKKWFLEKEIIPNDKEKIEDALQVCEYFISGLQQNLTEWKTTLEGIHFDPEVMKLQEQCRNSMEKIKYRLLGQRTRTI
ncbi:hypothetical protein AAA799O18_00353 [Marine Group I thaumarchaeote SCGC AAA799-O18]|nr:hypothetical protein AAA799O18_00353 [Marine Group I thaumarchaeote SCGC AAA799-O18]